MTVLRFATTAIVLVVLIITFYGVLKIVLEIPMMLFGLVVAFLKRGPEWLAAAMRVSGLYVMGIAIITFMIFSSKLLPPNFLVFWHSNIARSIIMIAAVLLASRAGAYNPFARQGAVFTIAASMLIGVVVVIASLLPDLFNASAVWWAATVATVLLFGAGAFSIIKISGRMRTFTTLDNRHDEIGRQLNRLRHIFNVLPETTDRVVIQDALASIDSQYGVALRALRGGNVEHAEEAILSAEAEIEGLNRQLDDRVRLSLRDELKTKLEQATSDCSRLRSEFLAIGLLGTEIDELEGRLASLSQQIDNLVFNPDQLPSQVEPFEQLLSDIVNTRTALRFRGNVDASLDRLQQELLDASTNISLANALGVNSDSVVEAQEKLRRLIDEFRSQRTSPAKELVERYRNVREAASSLLKYVFEPSH